MVLVGESLRVAWPAAAVDRVLGTVSGSFQTAFSCAMWPLKMSIVLRSFF